jgi:hypothetical protein
MIESALREYVAVRWGVVLDWSQLRDHVESVQYDHRDQDVRAKVIPPSPPPQPDAETDLLKVDEAIEKGKRRGKRKAI